MRRRSSGFIVLALAVVFLGVATPAEATRTDRVRATDTSREVVIQPGIFFLTDPCALGGQGEEVELVSGTVVFTYAGDRLRRVDYRGVVGIGTTSGVEYAVAYWERQASTTQALLEIVGGGTHFRQSTVVNSKGQVTSRSSCL